MTRKEAFEYITYKVDEKEPVFILRARDVLAAPTIFKWVVLAKNYHVPSAKIESALTVAGSFLNYTGEKKIPD